MKKISSLPPLGGFLNGAGPASVSAQIVDEACVVAKRWLDVQVLDGDLANDGADLFARPACLRRPPLSGQVGGQEFGDLSDCRVVMCEMHLPGKV